MELTLFDFDFSQEAKTEEELEKSFRELQEWHKERRLPYKLRLQNLPSHLRMDIERFKEKGWIIFDRLTNESTFEIADEKLLHYTVEELISNYRENMESLLQRKDVCWYKYVLNLRNFHGPIRYKDKETKDEYYRQKDRITKEAALRLGLEHFRNIPSSRGMKMSHLDSTWQKEHVLPLITKHALPIMDIDEMEQFFKEHVFFCGRWDWNTKGVPPRVDIKGFIPTEFDLACLCQAKDEKTVKEIFDYMGCSMSSGVKEGKILLFPEGWSKEKYYESLTEKDKQTLEEDRLRLERLHGREINISFF
ncbi:hypothetical protein ACA30_13375 [Virgibacillus soli]|nr:hypothetical protein ACA30_13375 [Virgibacillus soli]